MTDFALTEADMSNVGLPASMSVAELQQRAEVAGYSNPVAHRAVDAGVSSWTLVIDDDPAPNRNDVLTALAAATYTPLTSDATVVNVAADGVATGVVNFTGLPNSTVNLAWQGTLPISSAQIALDDLGTGSVTFGPTTQLGSGINVVATPATDSSDPVILTVSFT